MEGEIHTISLAQACPKYLAWPKLHSPQLLEVGNNVNPVYVFEV